MSNDDEAITLMQQQADNLDRLDGGVLTKDSRNMTHFVAEDFSKIIKLSSPTTAGTSSLDQVPSPEHSRYNRFKRSTRNEIEPFTPDMSETRQVLDDLEIQAHFLASSIDNLTENLCNLLHSISSISAANVSTFSTSVNKLTDQMDLNIKIMYTIMAKTEEINKKIKETETIYQKIKDVRRLVEMLENTL